MVRVRIPSASHRAASSASAAISPETAEEERLLATASAILPSQGAIISRTRSAPSPIASIPPWPASETIA